MLLKKDVELLDTIVSKMVENGESDKDIKFIINDFKQSKGVAQNILPTQPDLSKDSDQVKNVFGKSLAVGATQFGASVARAIPIELESLENKNIKPSTKRRQAWESLALKIENLVPKETTKEVMQTASGELWPDELKEVPDVIKTWSANLALNIPQIGATVALGPKKVIRGVAAMIASEVGNQKNSLDNKFDSWVREQNIPEDKIPEYRAKWDDISSSLALDYGAKSGIVEYVGNAIGPLKTLNRAKKEVANKFINEASEFLTGTVIGGGIEEAAQSELSNKNTAQAIALMKSQFPEFNPKFEREDLVRSFLLGAGVSGAIGGGIRGVQAVTTPRQIKGKEIPSPINETVPPNAPPINENMPPINENIYPINETAPPSTGSINPIAPDFKLPKGGKVNYTFSDYDTSKIPEYTTRIQFPEMLQLIKEVGNLPIKIREKIGRDEQTLGAFFHSGKIVLKSALAENPDLASKVFGHEIGHYIDFMPDNKMTNNLLGKLSGIKPYYNNMIQNDPLSSSKVISKEDKTRLQAESEQMGSVPQDYVVEEPIYENISLTPDDVKNIWNKVDSKDTHPELFDFIARLDANAKKLILKQAFNNVVAEELRGLGKEQIGVKKTVKQRMVKRSKAEIKKLFEELLRKEIETRNLYTLEQVKEELKALSIYWRPLPENAPPDYLKYRQSANELYADLFSVIINDPASAIRLAPNSFRLFFNYLDNKPTFKSSFFGLMEKYSNMDYDKILDIRRGIIEEGFASAEDKFLAMDAIRNAKDTDLFSQIKFLFINRNFGIFKMALKDFKENKIANPDNNLLYLLNELPYYGSDVHTIFEKMNRFRDEYLKQGATDKEFGLMLLNHRVAFGDRGKFFNVGGLDIKGAKDLLDKSKRDFSKEKFIALENAVFAMRDIFKEDVIKPAENIISEDLYKTLMESNTVYAGFISVEHIIDDYVSAEFYRQIGSFDEIANPFIAVLLKTIAIRKATMINEAKLEIAKQLLLYHSDEIETAKVIPGGYIKSKKGLEPFMYKVKGVRKALLVDSWIAKAFDNAPVELYVFVANFLGKVNKYFRYSFVVFNIGFQGFNFVRDFLRTWQNLPGINFIDIIRRYIDSVPTSIRRGFGLHDELIQEMYKSKALLLTYNDYLLSDTSEFSEIERLLTKYNVKEENIAKTNIMLRSIASVFNFIKKVGDVIETMPKVVGYKYLIQKGLNPREAADFTRRYVGTPDIKMAGHAKPAYNNIWLFSNVIIQGLKADIELATGPTTRHGFWFKGMMLTLFPMLLLLYYRDRYDKWYKRQTEYQKSNFILLPIADPEQYATGEGQEDWKTLRIPFPESARFAHAILWKALTIGEHPNLYKSLEDIFAIGAGQLPNLSPAIKIAGGIKSTLSGQNVYDPFYQKLIYSDDQMAAKGLTAGISKLETFSKWTAGQTGVWPLTVWAKSGNNISKRPIYQDVLKITPVLSRWIISEPTGINEKLYETLQNQKSIEATKRLDVKQEYLKYVRLIRNGEVDTSDAFLMFLKDNYDVKTLTNKNLNSYKSTFIRNVYKATGKEEALPMINATTTEQKIAVGVKMFELLGPTTTVEVLQDLTKIKILSIPVTNKIIEAIVRKYKGGGV